MLHWLAFDGTVPPHPCMRCSAAFHSPLFCLPWATTTSRIYSERKSFCKRCMSKDLWIFWHILCRNVAWGASKQTLKIHFPSCSLHTSSIAGPLVAQTTHTICTRASSHVSEHPVKIRPWASFHGISDTLVLRRSVSCSPCICPVSKISWCWGTPPPSTPFL